ncbi:Endoplasmic reticulum transmembrane protein YET-like [Nosema granulosis]|uniref:Endoplasmic reticulum transmembrane protein n=1 Tax=Nosema granulosis TaxID=83296 RepID=A0A9P6GWQ9_9MICR|nr:Endoplasmic reticulum transmembrane protein YET-like [Nosema granulosis]
MGITTHLVQSILYTEMAIFTLLILPLPKYISRQFIVMFHESKFSRVFTNILWVLYTMVFILFVDSIYRQYSTVEDRFLSYHTERNFYLTGFTLYLALIFRMFTQMLSKLQKEEQSAKILKKQALNQKTFVDDLMKKIESKDEKILELETETKDLNKKILSVEVLLKQYKNNQNEYFSLLEKYNDLENKMRKETKKSK